MRPEMASAATQRSSQTSTSFGPEKKRETGTTYTPDNLQQIADSLVGNLQCGEQEREDFTGRPLSDSKSAAAWLTCKVQAAEEKSRWDDDEHHRGR